MMPTAPQCAFPHGEEAPADQADLTALANFAGLPALSVPVPGEGLPASVQLIGHPFGEAALLSVGRVLDRLLSARLS
jgi:aspartyl-tRNA(Asn)/glutamyl-tRNA(Gln) amidotransferase subunit A